MSSSLVELQSLIAQSLDGTPRSRRDHQGFQVALISPHRSLVPSSCLVVEFCHNNIKYHILFSNGTTALVQVSSPKSAATDLPQENHQLLSISHSQDAVEIYSDLSSQLEIIQSVEQVHDLRKFLYFIFIVYFQKNRLPCSKPELKNEAQLQVVPIRPHQGRITRPKALSVEKRLCLPYEVRRKLTFESKLALTEKPTWENKPMAGVELGRRLVIPMFESFDNKEILITRKNIARDFLQNLILQKLQKTIPSFSRAKNEVLASSAQGPIPLPSQESFEAPKPFLKMNPTPREKILSIPPQNLLILQKFKNHIEIFGNTRKALVTPLKQTIQRSKKCQTNINNYCLMPSLPDLSFERNFNRIISERIAKMNSSICEKSLNLLQIWAKSSHKIQTARVSLPPQPILSAPLRDSFFLTENRSLAIPSQALVVSSSSKKLKLSSGLSNSSLNSILKAHYNSIQYLIQKDLLELLPLNLSRLRKPLALTYKKTLALTYNVEKVYALPCVQRLAITYAEPEAIPLHGTGPVIALPNKPILALTYQPTLALPYERVLALECEKKLAITYGCREEPIYDIHRFLEPKWLDYMGANSLPKGTLKLFSEPNCPEQTASVELSFSSSQSQSQSEDDFDYDLDEEISLQESLIEESRGENLPLLQAQSTSELSEIDLDLQVSAQLEQDYGFEIIADDDVVIIEAPEDTIVSIDEI